MSWTFDGVVEFACLGKNKYWAMFCLLDALISIDQAKGGLISNLQNKVPNHSPLG